MLYKLISFFEDANNRFLNENVNFILSNVSERSLCHCLGQSLYYVLMNSDFSSYHIDVEYNRNNGRIKTISNENLVVIPIVCDLIVHSRGEIVEKDNLIAIEMKKSYRSRSEKDKDKARLIALTKQSYDDVWSFDGFTFPEHVCGYELGIYYEINITQNKVFIEYYAKGLKITEYEIPIRRNK